MTAPKLSFIVLSYNYERFIRQTVDSILAQTVSDFEIVVVDDCSSDASREVIRSYADPRVRLIENERNLGGAGSYNVAVGAAKGEWLVNLDADDWIAPRKSEIMLDRIVKDPSIDVIGSWVSVVDASGERSPIAAQVEAIVNQRHKLNLAETWIGSNPLCRSSTMIRRSAHLRFGLDDADMVRAPDYELWTRALAYGSRFHLVEEPLTFMRQHGGGVTHADPVGTYLEMSYAMIRNLAPLAERRSLLQCQTDIVRWIATNDSRIRITPRQSVKLLGFAMTLRPLAGFKAFRENLADPTPDLELERLGRFAFIAGADSVPRDSFDKLQSDVLLFIEARDYWKEQHDRAVEAITNQKNQPASPKEKNKYFSFFTPPQNKDYKKLIDDIKKISEARDYWKAQHDRVLKDTSAYIEARDYWKAQHDRVLKDTSAYIEARDYRKAQNDSVPNKSTN